MAVLFCAGVAKWEEFWPSFYNIKTEIADQFLTAVNVSSARMKTISKAIAASLSMLAHPASTYDLYVKMAAPWWPAVADDASVTGDDQRNNIIDINI